MQPQTLATSMKIRLLIILHSFLIIRGYSQTLKEDYTYLIDSYYSFDSSDSKLYAIGYEKSDSLINVNPNDGFAYFFRAFCLKRIPRTESVNYEKIQTPYRIDSIITISYSGFDTVQYLNDLNKSILLDSFLSESYLERSNFLRFIDSKKSLDDISIYINLNLLSLDGYLYRGLIYEDLKLYDLAILDFKKAYSLGGYDFAYYDDMARISFKQQKYLEAINYYTKSIKINPSGLGYKGRGICYYKLGDFNKAIPDLEKAVGVIDNGDTYFFLIDSSMKIKNNIRACEYFNEAVKSPSFLLTEEYSNAILILDGKCK
ncbi:tetratricopeptide repeat protein [Cytophaga aurantiaca]|uniref:tetratricopeptide repeat protein n=1 Tax=Cytophaga aurantiaca TaxID=29530 RepID=UPI0003796E31|nr:hypothetical protein [Cytophaga aurantiaca]